MSAHKQNATPRREFLKSTAGAAAGLALAGLAIPRVHAAEANTIRLALIGCGGRGTGAVANAMSAGGLVLGDDGGTQRTPGSAAGGPIQLVAMADLRPDRPSSEATPGTSR
jgi:predicted sugar kinase